MKSWIQQAGQSLPSPCSILWRHCLLPCKKLCLSHLMQVIAHGRGGSVAAWWQQNRAIHHKTPVHTLRKRHLDAILSCYNTCHCSTEILWSPTCNLFIPVAFPMHRKKELERILYVQSLVSQTILPSGFVLHFKVDLSKSNMFAV